MKQISLKLTALISLCGALTLFNAEPASAGACQTYIDKANAVFGNLIKDSCVGINTDASLTNNPFVYVNADGGCDLGLQLPGLPDFGSITGGGINACSIVKAVTGSMVDTVNSSIRGAMNDTVNGINSKSQQVGGIDVINSGNTNIGDMVTEQIRNAAANAGQ
ncbi:hypothetical protein RBE51_19555 [Pseudomonas taiwanensis]|uniref:hypothetical protein n=1 Tax=Pseudomonas taiwanensis TaxID=470150 RepID=UPI0028DFC808|nr:hypothetical protein [Pseudomonas taiwanensis]MDT8924988.1 hypothetical protein [Pseudomonas taiwanensis]